MIMKTAMFVKVLGTLILLALTAMPAEADEFSLTSSHPAWSPSDIHERRSELFWEIRRDRDNWNIRWQRSIGPLLFNPNQPNAFVAPGRKFLVHVIGHHVPFQNRLSFCGSNAWKM